MCRLLLVAITTLSPACARVGYWGTRADWGEQAEAHLDRGPRPDVRRPSDLAQPSDVPRPDLAQPSDLPRPDLPADQPRPPDTRPPETGSLRDLPVVDGPGVPCAASATVAQVLAPGAVICQGPSNAYHQCIAAQLCNLNQGWSLCPASVYRQRVTSPPAMRAWIGGCIRSGGPVYAPTDFPCPSCSVPSGATANISWHCTPPTSTWSPALVIGVISDPICRRMGVNSPAWAGYWDTELPPSGLSLAVCCWL